MGFFRDLNPAVPTDASLLRDGDDELRAIKQALWDQWPNFAAAACTPSVSEINALAGINTGQSIQAQLDALIDKSRPKPLPSSARNFQDATFWGLSGDQDQHRIYYDYAIMTAYSNVPWKWGSHITPGEETDYLLLWIDKYVNNSQNIALHRVVMAKTFGGAPDPAPQEYLRAGLGGAAGSNIMVGTWQRSTTSQISTSQSTSGDVIDAGAKYELLEIGCNPQCP